MRRRCNDAITVLLIMQALVGAPKVPGMSEDGELPICLCKIRFCP